MTKTFTLLFMIALCWHSGNAQCSLVTNITANGPTSKCAGSTIILTANSNLPNNVWTQKTNFGGISRQNAVGFSIGNKGYIGTGVDDYAVNILRDFWEYDPATNAWTQKANFAGSSRYDAVGFNIGNKGYIGCGRDNSDYKKDFWEYNPTTNTWVRKADYTTTCAGGTSFSIGSKGYMVSGFAHDFWEYNPTNDTWIKKADFAGGWSYQNSTSFTLNNKGYVGIGNAGSSFLNDFWEYNPVTDSWLQKATLPGVIYSYTSGFAINNKGYIGTGWDGISSSLNQFWEYDPATNTWTQKANVGGSVRSGGVGFNIGNKGYIGTGGNTTVKKDFWEYTPTPAPTYLWDNGATTQSIAVTATGFYGVTITDANGCSDYDYIHVVIESPSVVINGPTSICQYSNTVLWTNNVIGNTYKWSANAGGATTYSVAIYPAGTAVYTLTATNGIGCKTSKTVTVTVNPLPNVSITGPSVLCQSGTTTLTAHGGTSYLWSNFSSANSISVSPAINSLYSVTGKDGNGCSNTVTRIVTVMQTPTVTISGLSPICQGQSTILTASGGNTYLWSANAGAATSNTVSVAPMGTTTYSVAGIHANGCNQIVSKTVVVYPAPVVAVSGIGAICRGEATVLKASGEQSYTWSPNAGGAHTPTVKVSPSSTTSYTVTETNKYGCHATGVKTVIVNQLPNISITGQNTIEQGAHTLLTANGGATYTWSPNAGSVNTPAVDVAPYALGNTYYSVYATDLNGCPGSAQFIVTVGAASMRKATDHSESGLESALITRGIYPNPTTGLLYLSSESAGEGTVIEIYDITGRKVLSQAVKELHTLINLTELSNGLYHVAVYTNAGLIYQTKIVKQN